MGLEKVKSYPGVYKLTSTKRRFKGKLDECYYVYYKVRGVAKKAKIGWRSEGYTAQMASEMRAEQIKKFRHGIVEDKPITVNEVWKKVEKKYNNNKDSRNPKQRFYHHIKPYVGDKTLSGITPTTLDWMLNKYKEKNLSSSSINHNFVILKQIFKTAITDGEHSKNNPFDYWKYSTKIRHRTRFLSQAEAELLLNDLYERSYETYAKALFGLHTGARLGEIVNLRWNNVDFENKTVLLRERKSGSDGYVYLTNKLVQVLKEKYQYSADTYVFPSPRPRGGKIRSEMPTPYKKAVYRLFNKDCDKENRVNFHTLRHTFASWLVMQGTPLYYVSKLLGHASIKMTERYAHLAPDRTRSEIERMFESDENEKVENPKKRVVNF